MDKLDKVIIGLLKEMVDCCCEDQIHENKGLHFHDKDNKYCDRFPIPPVINSEKLISIYRFSCHKKEKDFDMPSQSLAGHLEDDVMYKNLSQEASTRTHHISQEVPCDMILPKKVDMTQTKNTKIEDKLKSEKTDSSSISDDFNKTIHTCGNETMKKNTPIEKVEVKSEKKDPSSISGDFDTTMQSCGNETMTPENILIISQECKKNLDEIKEKTMTPENLLIISQECKEHPDEIQEKTMTPEKKLIISQFDELIVKSTTPVQPSASNGENRPEENIDLKLENCINDYSAKTPAQVTEQQIDIRSVGTGVRSTFIGNCQIESKNYELAESENVLLDVDEALMHYVKDGLQEQFVDMLPLCCDDHGLVNGIKESAIGQGQANGRTEIGGFFENIEDEFHRSGESKLLDNNFRPRCINSQQLSTENSQFKYICEELDDDILEADMNDINKLDLSEHSDRDALKDSIVSAELVVNAPTVLNSNNNEEFYPESPDFSSKTNIIMESCKPAETTEVSKDSEINLVSTLHEEESMTSQEKGGCNSFNGKILVCSGRNNFADRSSNDDEELLAPELCKRGRFSFENDDVNPRNLSKFKQTRMSFDSIETMPALNSPVHKTPEEKTSLNASDIYRETTAWCLDSDDGEDYEVYAPTQRFKPHVSADMLHLHVEDDPVQEFDDEVENLKVRKREDEAVVPEMSKALLESHQTYSTDSETDLFKPDLHRLVGKQCFNWSTCSQQIGEDSTYDYTDGKNNNLTKSGCEFPGLRQLVACSRPLRLGLSKKQKTKRLHPYFQ